MSSSGLTGGGFRYAEAPNCAANNRGCTEAESDSEKDEVQHEHQSIIIIIIFQYTHAA